MAGLIVTMKSVSCLSRLILKKRNLMERRDRLFITFQNRATKIRFKTV